VERVSDRRLSGTRGPLTQVEDRAYWEARLNERFGLDGVGYLGLGPAFNEWMYRVRRDLFCSRVRPLVQARPDLSVLDVGSGTGFYLGLWRELGVRSVTGSDLTEAAVSRLRPRYPDVDLVRWDVGGEGRLENGPFGAISAFDVLFHIVDDERYARAFRNLFDLLEPGGHLLFTDNFLHGPTQRSETQVSRSLEEIEGVVRQTGFEVVARRPAFVLMNAPIDSRSRALGVFWTLLTKTAGASDRLGRLAGAALYPLEAPLARRLEDGPTTELMVCRRPG
jgi:SAM-dependent methyltransferase